MNLPSLPRTEHTFKSDFWPSVIKYRAFTAGQQTLLLQVSDPGTPEDERSSAMDVLFSQCVEAGAPFNSIPIGVVEEIFIRMRMLSIGEIMKIRYKCNQEIEVTEKTEDDKEIKTMKQCGQEIVVSVPLSNVKCSPQPGFRDVFDLPGGYHLKMRQPSFANSKDLQGVESIEVLIATFINCLYDDDGQVWNFEDPNEPGIPPELAIQRSQVREEFIKWVGDNIETEIIEQISQDFFHKIPRVAYKSKVKCPGCGKEHVISFNGINEIFI